MFNGALPTRSERTGTAAGADRTAPGQLVGLKALAAALGVRPDLLRRIVSRCDDFPCQRRGGKGVPYRFDVAAAKAWWRRHYRRAMQSAEFTRDRRTSLKIALSVYTHWRCGDPAREIEMPRGVLGDEYYRGLGGRAGAGEQEAEG